MSTYRFYPVLLAALIVGLTFAGSVAPVEAASACEVLQAGYCGDGFCDPYIGENATSCPADCAPKTAVPPTGAPPPAATPTPTLTATLTRVPLRPTSTPTRTPSPTSTPTSTSTPVEPTQTPAATFTFTPTATPVASATPAPAVLSCRLVSYESMSRAWRTAYRRQASSAYTVPAEANDQEVYVCDQPPVGRLCFPMYGGLLDAASGDETLIALIDCPASGDCTVADLPGTFKNNQFCFDIPAQSGISCSVGCALVLRPTAEFPVSALPFDLSSPIVIIPLGIIAVLLTGFILFLIILLFRRHRAGDEEDEP